jgi:glycosyltransferase involved in cell wall biosynthesis
MSQNITSNKNTEKFLSVCIPTYEMHGLGYVFLKQSFNILLKQTFKDFEIIVVDNSNENSIENLCNEYKKFLDIKYYRYPNQKSNSSKNTNLAIQKASGKLIKILFQDDFLYSENSLEETIRNFDLNNDHWLVSACEHSKNGVDFYQAFFPKYNKEIYLGNNTISSPSVLTIKNDNPIFFDEKLIWLMDCDYYKRCYDKFGEPKILNKITVVNRVGEHQVSHSRVTKLIEKTELAYIKEKYMDI